MRVFDVLATDMNGAGLSLLLLIYIAFVGACLGSFVNVVVSRLPEGLSIIRPRSRCPICQTPIAWFDNIPIVSYLRLRGRCRACHVRIPARYVVIECIVMVLACALALRFGWSVDLLRWMIVMPVLVAITFIDIDHWYIPDVLIWPALAWVVFTALLPPHWDAVILIVLGLVPALLLWLVGVAFTRITGREGLGLGDIKLLALIGAAIGVSGGLVVLFLSSVQGAIIGTLVVLCGGHKGVAQTPQPDAAQRHNDHRDAAQSAYDDWTPPPNAIPFGPFLVLGTLEYLLLPNLFANLPYTLAHRILEVLP